MHLGLIPDGHRRYAEERGISDRRAYLKAKNLLDEIIRDLDTLTEQCGEQVEAIDTLTVYALSEENLRREEEELVILYEMLEEYAEAVIAEFPGTEYDVRWLSTAPETVPASTREAMDRVADHFTGDEITINILLSYTGKADIVNAANAIADGSAPVDPPVSTADFADALELSTDIDYVIRTGDNPRRECLSGFPIWNAAYAEYYHYEKNFPALTVADMQAALDHVTSLRQKRGR
ncbi:MAG: undecaprenyl diphosphate synthase family protein [Halococcoides sp.]